MSTSFQSVTLIQLCFFSFTIPFYIRHHSFTIIVPLVENIVNFYSINELKTKKKYDFKIYYRKLYSTNSTRVDRIDYVK